MVNPELSFAFENGKIMIDIPSKHQRLEVTSDTLKVLLAISKETKDKDMAIRELEKEYLLDNLHVIIEDLLSCNILVKLNHQFEYPNKWKDWKKSTWTFHLDSRDVPYASTPKEEYKYIEYVNKTPPPDIYKCDCEKTEINCKLPAPKELDSGNLTNIFFKRRTCRNYLDESVDLEKLSTVIFFTGGALFEAGTTHFGKGLIKSVPSPGARHSTEIYLYARKCDQLKPGIYHYCVKHHALNFVSGVEPNFLKKGIYNQAYFEQASAIFFFTCVVDRTMWKYKTTKAYRQLHFEIGHYCQNLLLTGTALNLAVFQTGAVYDSYIESYLQINGCDEFLMYCAGIGIEDTTVDSIDTATPLNDFWINKDIKLPKKFERF